jgi:hypothetical protein
VDGKVWYCNTDLDLKSANDLTALAAEFDAKGLEVLHVTLGDDGLWHSIIEADEPWENPASREPERSIAQMLDVVESLDHALAMIWSRCTLREFNIGYDCGDEPWAFNQGLSHGLLSRIVTAGASIRVTLYPDRDESS